MTTLIAHKRVEYTELFYDLVFVYAISKTTSLIHHLEHGILPLFNFFTFFTCLLVLVNTWMIQTIFTNRYGKNSLLNMSIMFIDMGLLLLLANSFSLNWESNFQTFTLIISILSATLLIQYYVQYTQTTATDDKEIIKSFFYILGLRTVGVFVSFLLPYTIGIWVYFFSIIGSFIMPIVFTTKMKQVPINFPHLVERVSLLVIIMFGEMIVGVAGFFTIDTFNWQSILDLLIVVLLFLLYFSEFDHALDSSKNTLGLGLIYSHYLVFTGILMTTVSMTFLSEQDANHLFVVLFLYVGLLLFITALLLNGIYNKPAYKWTKKYIQMVFVLFFIGFIFSLIFSSSDAAVTIITVSTLISLWMHFILFYLKRHKASNDPQKIYFI